MKIPNSGKARAAMTYITALHFLDSDGDRVKEEKVGHTCWWIVVAQCQDYSTRKEKHSQSFHACFLHGPILQML
jgi:hypothetical protein